MSVIAEVRIPAEEFELGRILEMDAGTTITLETLVPLGDQAVPFFRVYDHGHNPFEGDVETHPAVEEIRLVSEHDDEALYALDWTVSPDSVLGGIRANDAQILEAQGGADTWAFELRFDTHGGLAGFQEHCATWDIPLEVGAIYNPTKPGSRPWFGLTAPQRETLVHAVREGYYEVPRTCSTLDLAEHFDISDQAVSERLRRGIRTLVENTIMGTEETASPETVMTDD